MKKILVLLLISFASFAQLKKGTFTAGSKVLELDRDGKTGTDKFMFSPSVGFIVAKNIEYGFSFNISHQSGTDFNSSYTDEQSSITNYIIKYFGKGKFQPFATAGVDFLNSNSDGISGMAGLGVHYFVSPTVAIGGQYKIYDIGRNVRSRNFGVNFTFFIPQKNK